MSATMYVISSVTRWTKKDGTPVESKSYYQFTAFGCMYHMTGDINQATKYTWSKVLKQAKKMGNRYKIEKIAP